MNDVFILLLYKLGTKIQIWSTLFHLIAEFKLNLFDSKIYVLSDFAKCLLCFNLTVSRL